MVVISSILEVSRLFKTMGFTANICQPTLGLLSGLWCTINKIATRSAMTFSPDRGGVFDVLSAILALSGLSLVDGALAEAAILRGRESGQEFADAYIAASADIHGAGEIATFNQRDFEKLRSNLHDF